MVKDKIILLLRGLPGSGKTKLAQALSENGKYPTLSVDDYFTNSDTGEYAFDFSKNYLAYKNCEEKTCLFAQRDTLKIIVHNTFTMIWEMEPYFKIAAEYNYLLFVVTVENYHGGENNHGVTKEQLLKMSEKYKVKLI